MRYYKNVREALFETERDLVEMGIDNWPKSMQNRRVEGDEDYRTKELIGYSFRIHNAEISESMGAASKFHKIPLPAIKGYCGSEIFDRVGFKAVNPGSSWTHRKEVWEQFLNSEGRFDYTYSERLTYLIRFAREVLQNDPSSRQCILQVFHPTDIQNAGGKKRIPCSMYYQFLNRPQGFHIMYTMRSCDLYTHFGIDVTLAIQMAHLLKDSLGIALKEKPVVFTMFIGSLHAYKKDYGPRGVF